jgi:hypothetical protein
MKKMAAPVTVNFFDGFFLYQKSKGCANPIVL